MLNTANELNNIDISPLKSFTGPTGMVSYNYQKLNPNARTQEWRDYEAFKNSIQILAMDSMRKGFGTSVVPDYVYATLGKLSNPNSSIFNDPEQVQKNWNSFVEWVNKSAENSAKQARRGATVNLNDKVSSELEKTKDPLGIL